MIKVGIPRALLYYQYYPMWKTFFEEIGAELVVSPPTTQTMLSEGSLRVVADTCLPVKVFCGHVLSLIGKCDYIFVPVVRSVKRRVYNCSKFLGLSDMTKAVIPECPPVLDIDIDINKGRREMYRAIYRLGGHFSRNPFRVRQAAMAAWQTHLVYQRLMSSHELTPPLEIAKIMGEAEPEATNSTQTTIALVGHPYLLYDEHINHSFIRRLEQAHSRVLTPEMLTREELEVATIRLMGRAYWTYEDEVVGAGEHYLQGGVDGVIGIMAFGCGPDSLMMDMVRRASKMTVTPFMSLTLEEHSSEAGVVTRLEAFLDMIHRRKRRKASVCV